MAILTAYFDASGHPSDQPFVVVSGYVANHLQWRVLNANWNETHIRFKKALPFHMTDFMHGKSPYDAWEVGDKNMFLLSLCTAQQLSCLLSVACIVDMGSYRDANDVLLLDTILPAFALGARFCVEMIEDWKKVHFEKLDIPVECIFEDGDFGKGKFIELMRVERMPAPIFKDKRDYPGLQAADHMAWEIANFVKRQEKSGESVLPSESFSHLLTIPHIHKRTTLTTLLNIAEKKGLPIRRSQIIKP